MNHRVAKRRECGRDDLFSDLQTMTLFLIRFRQIPLMRRWLSWSETLGEFRYEDAEESDSSTLHQSFALPHQLGLGFLLLSR